MLLFKDICVFILFLLDLGTILTIKFGTMMFADGMPFNYYASVISAGAVLNIALSNLCLNLALNN